MAQNKGRFIIFFFLVSVANDVFAQIKPPRADIQLKAGTTSLTTFQNLPTGQLQYEYKVESWMGEANINITERFAIGAFYARGGNTTRPVFPTGIKSYMYEYDGSHQFYGLKLRLSSGLRPKLRPFIEASVGFMNMSLQNDSFSEDLNTSVFGGSIGLMIKLKNNFYLVLPQFKFQKRGDEFSFESYEDPTVEILGGLSINFGKRK